MPYLLFRRDAVVHGVNCAFTFCHSPLPTHPTTNEAEGTPDAGDPSLRDPNAALDDYKRRMNVETVLGIIFVLAVVCVAAGLWIGLDKELRKRLLRWGAATKAFVLGRNRAPAKNIITNPTPYPPRNTNTDATVGNADMPLGPERTMRVMPCVLESKSASRSIAGSSIAEKKERESIEGLPVLPHTSTT
ncbi:hypothetical protein EIP86_002932 [Pleurotus ostreatoroseus]|nr:hypothetical protein EIP86_002932 [Pleurotus ostreatoroseus]